MLASFRKSISLVSGVCLGSLAVASPASAQQAQQPPQGWFKVCSKQEDNDICNVQNIRTANTGQLLTAVNLIQITGKVNRAIFQIAVPTGRVIPAGIGLQIDNGQARKIDYAICLPDRCIAEAPLADEFVASLKRGGELKLTSINFQNQPNPISMSLDGFTAAFDGEPLEQSEVESRQQQLQEAIEKRRADFQKKLKEEQEKAKQAN
ncbi:invasion associated locus B family protein [Oricola cellulosilytica]|uniref:Invasion associated locus B family protein n=1 Tax=Oricola cellulosilytica TaxID=1429082 RepID=A0A4R0PBB3_9HYPH|nr:invasion associated locus B family protein [Oricola cellulosilytica]TCD13184.1 invasion associated locus B family protein [Oricola cellulosilytica]